MTISQPTGSCFFGVTREGNGTGRVTVTNPDGSNRVIFFEKGSATGYDMNQANPSDFSVKRQDDISLVRIGQERYEILDAVIYGS